MIPKLSENAQKSFDEYLNQVKVLLRYTKSIDSDEIVQNINDYIENELADAIEPVGSDELEDVLKKLGSPEQWVPEEITWWKKFILRLRCGPEDWRLAYLSFGLLLIGFIFLPLILVFLTASYLVSRAALSLCNNNLQVKEQKWLIYPSLIIVNVLLLSLLLFWPLFISVNLGYGFEHDVRKTYSQFTDDLQYWLMATSFIISSLGIWWLIFANMLKKKNSIFQKILWPFFDMIKKKWLIGFWFVSLLMIIIFTAIGILFWF